MRHKTKSEKVKHVDFRNLAEVDAYLACVFENACVVRDNAQETVSKINRLRVSINRTLFDIAEERSAEGKTK